jgi:rare lipoprotein A
VTLAAGALYLRNPPRPAATAIRVGPAAQVAPAPAEPPAAPQTPPAGAAAAATGAISLAELARDLKARAATSTTRAPATTVTTARPAPTTTAAAVATTSPPAPPAPTTSTTAAPLTPLTTIAEGIAPPLAAASSALPNSDSGVASWFRAPEATCAHRTLPMGTIVKVTRHHNGATTTCRVDDRGPTLETGRLIDLSLDTFEKLAAREAGLIDVTIEW